MLENSCVSIVLSQTYLFALFSGNKSFSFIVLERERCWHGSRGNSQQQRSQHSQSREQEEGLNSSAQRNGNCAAKSQRSRFCHVIVQYASAFELHHKTTRDVAGVHCLEGQTGKYISLKLY